MKTKPTKNNTPSRAANPGRKEPTTMTKFETATKALQARLKLVPTKQLKEIIIQMNEQYSKEAITIEHYGLAELEKRIPADDFISFCDAL
jgi:hypothetical protein